MSFFRHREIFRSDVIRLLRERRNRRSLAHRLDEFPVDYSLTSCTPAALASALPTGIHSATQARRPPRTFQPTANSVLTFCATSGGNRSSAPLDANYSAQEPLRLTKPRNGKTAALSIDELRALREQLEIGSRKLDVWVTLYTYQLDPSLSDYLRLCDNVTLWTWKPEDLSKLETNFEKARELAPDSLITLIA